MKTVVAVGVTAIVSLAAGAAGGYFFAKKTLDDKYNEIMEREISEARKYFERRSKTGKFSTPAKAAAALAQEDSMTLLQEAVVNLGYSVVEVEKAKQSATVHDSPVDSHGDGEAPAEEGPIIKNLFEDNRDGPDLDDRWAWEEEVKNRDNTKPYVIDVEDFMQNEQGRTQNTLTYFEADSVLVDESDQPIPAHSVNNTVGEENLNRFGVRSRDKNIVYVRNENMDMDFEILRSEQSYRRDILGLEGEGG